MKPAPGVELADLIDATPEEIDEARGLAERAGAGLGTVLFDRWARAVDEASQLPTPRLLYEMAAIDLCAAEPMVPLGDLLQRLDDLEGRLRGARPVPVTGAGGGSAGPAPGTTVPKAKPAASGPRAWGAPPAAAAPATMTPAPAAPAPATPVPASPALTAAVAPAPPEVRAAPAASSDEAWRRVLAIFEKKSMSLGAMLAHADVVALAAGGLTLSFAQKRDADRAERDAAEIEGVVSSVLGKPIKLTVVVGAAANGTAVRSEIGQQHEAASADRKAREAEARQHPLIRSAQDVFGASLKEIKT